MTNLSVTVGVSIHAPLARSDPAVPLLGKKGAVSIHAPLARSDCEGGRQSFNYSSFNPRSPREERRWQGCSCY